jgi:hypothetical protein
MVQRLVCGGVPLGSHVRPLLANENVIEFLLDELVRAEAGVPPRRS